MAVLISAIHPDALAWERRVNAQGGTIAPKTLVMTSHVAKWCYANGLRDVAEINHKIKFWLPLGTDDFNGLFIPVWHPTANAICTNNNFVAADYSKEMALQGDGVSKYIDSLVLIATITPSSYLACYSHTQGYFPEYNVGAGSSAISYYSGIVVAWDDEAVSFEENDAASISAVIPNTTGYFEGFRVDGKNYLYRNGVELAQNTALISNTAAPALSYFLFGINDSGGPFLLSTRRLCSFVLGQGITTSQAQGLSGQIRNWETIVRG
jgi:hypothetical protein